MTRFIGERLSALLVLLALASVGCHSTVAGNGNSPSRSKVVRVARCDSVVRGTVRDPEPARAGRGVLVVSLARLPNWLLIVGGTVELLQPDSSVVRQVEMNAFWMPLRELASGDYLVRATMDGFRSRTSPVQVRAGFTDTLIIGLEQTNPPVCFETCTLAPVPITCGNDA